jgi:hypothetical protein
MTRSLKEMENRLKTAESKGVSSGKISSGTNPYLQMENDKLKQDVIRLSN